MMNYQDEMKSVTVRVANGSGVIIKPLADDCFYILTAYHVVKGKTVDEIVFDFLSTSPFTNKTVKAKRIIYNEELDAAILIVEKDDSEIVQFVPSNIRQNGAVHWHTGYPNNQNSNGKANSCKLHDFNTWLGTYDHNFEEYKYPNHIKQEELNGMSGGGIFDDNHHLLGVHMKLAASEEKEQLGKNVMIPWSCFERVIAENGLPTIYQCNFEVFMNEMFNFDNNLGAKEKLKTLLMMMSHYRAGMLDLSPQQCYDAFQKSRKANNYLLGSELQKDDWVKFGEFIVALKAVWGLDAANNLDEVFPRFQYVQSEKDFDIYSAPSALDPSVLGTVSDVNVVFVVGGIQSKGYKQDVRGKDILDIAIGLEPKQEFNIARNGRENMGGFVYVNAHFFKDAMVAFTDEIRDCDGDKMEYYRNLITSKI